MAECLHYARFYAGYFQMLCHFPHYNNHERHYIHYTEEKSVSGGQWFAQGHPAKVSGGADTSLQV